MAVTKRSPSKRDDVGLAVLLDPFRHPIHSFDWISTCTGTDCTGTWYWLYSKVHSLSSRVLYKQYIK
jgi:hypothetical protein